MQQHQRGLTVTYLHLHEAQSVNVGTTPSLPHPIGKADLASGERGGVGQRLRSSRGNHAPLKATVTPFTGRREPVR